MLTIHWQDGRPDQAAPSFNEALRLIRKRHPKAMTAFPDDQGWAPCEWCPHVGPAGHDFSVVYAGPFGGMVASVIRKRGTDEQ